MNKLWNVEIRTELVVLAEDEREAERIAIQNISDESDNFEEIWANEITLVDEIPASWIDSIPYDKTSSYVGGGNQLTCLEFINKGK